MYNGIRAALRSRIFLTKVFGLMVISTLLVATSGWEMTSVIVDEGLFMVGVVLVAACASLRAWSLSYIAGSKDSRLITTGPYSLCRNPLYLANFVGAVGLGFCTETLFFPLAIFLVFALYYPRTIGAEEKRLRGLFGAGFERYASTVPRLLPSFSGYVEEDTMCVSTKSFRRGMRDLAFLISLVGVLEFIEALHEAQVLPTLFKLY